jgi:hypothetical protein
VARIRRLLPATVAAVLLFSLIFVNGSIAQPLGAGLLASFGVSSGSSNGGTANAPIIYGIPATIVNPPTSPVPVTIQGASGEPLTATIDGTVNTNATVQGTVSTEDVNDPTKAPYQYELRSEASGLGNAGSIDEDIPLSGDQRLIIRYISCEVTTSLNATARLNITTTTDGMSSFHFIPLGSVAKEITAAYHDFGLETWITADPGTNISISISFSGDDGTSNVQAITAISGYLVDMPTTP